MFFDPIPPGEDEPEQPPREPWQGPAAGTVPGVVALELVLAQSADVLVALPAMFVYPDGYSFELVVAACGAGVDLDAALGRGPWARRGRATYGEVPTEEELLRFGVQHADGAKATTGSGSPRAKPRARSRSVCTSRAVTAANTNGCSATGAGRCRRPARSRSRLNGAPRRSP